MTINALYVCEPKGAGILNTNPRFTLKQDTDPDQDYLCMYINTPCTLVIPLVPTVWNHTILGKSRIVSSSLSSQSETGETARVF